MRVLGPSDIAGALPMAEAIQAMREAFAAQASGGVAAPSRTVLRTGTESGATLVMPAALDSAADPLVVVKVVSVFPSNRRIGLPTIHGTLLAVDPRTGVPQAMLDGVCLTAIRTGATCGLATDLLARSGCRVLAVFGSGVHARTQVESVRTVRPIDEVRIFNPNTESARLMARELSGSDAGIERVLVAASAAEALDGADIASCATTSVVPVFDDRSLPDGIHVNAIGSFKPEDREIPAATVVRSRLVVDDRESALEEAGDLLIPIGEGLVGADHIHCELGDLVLGRREGRSSESQVTLFKSVGLAAQDLFAARAVLCRSERLGLGQLLR